MTHLIDRCACCGRERKIWARRLCDNCYRRFIRTPHLHVGWKDRYPRVSQRRSFYNGAWGPLVPAEPILRLIEARGGFREVADRAGIPGKSKERDTLNAAVNRARKRGHFTLHTADQVAVRLLDLVLDDIPGCDIP